MKKLLFTIHGTAHSPFKFQEDFDDDCDIADLCQYFADCGVYKPQPGSDNLNIYIPGRVITFIEVVELKEPPCGTP